jgi:hypothetical protein
MRAEDEALVKLKLDLAKLEELEKTTAALVAERDELKRKLDEAVGNSSNGKFRGMGPHPHFEVRRPLHSPVHIGAVAHSITSSTRPHHPRRAHSHLGLGDSTRCPSLGPRIRPTRRA